MPVVDEQSYAQFMQVMNQSRTATHEFALGIQRLKQAEEETKARLTMERERFDLEKQRWTAESALNGVRLAAATEELTAFKVKTQEQEGAKKELGAFNATVFSPYLETVRSGTPEQVDQMQAGLMRSVSQLSPAAQNMFYQTQQQAMEYKWFEPKVESEIAKNFATGRGSASILTSPDVLKNLQAIEETTRTTALGFDYTAAMKDLDSRDASLEKSQGSMKEGMLNFFKSKQIISEGEANAAIAQNLSQGGAMIIAMSTLNKAMEGAAGDDKKVIGQMIQDLQSWRAAQQLISAERNDKILMKQLVDVFVGSAMPTLSNAAAAGTADTGVKQGKAAADLLKPYSTTLQSLSNSREMATLRNTTDPQQRAALLSHIRSKLMEQVPKDGSPLDRVLVEKFMGSVDFSTRAMIDVTPVPEQATGGTGGIGSIGGR